MKQFQLTVTIDEDDVPLVYELFAHYHKNRAEACKSFRGLIDGTEKRVRVASTGTSTSAESDGDTLYYHVCKRCTCGSCYNSFVRTDRLPWTPIGGGKFEHACAGIVQVSETCPVYNCRVPGYIYRSVYKTNELRAAEQDLVSKQLANEKARAKIEQEKEVHQMKIERLKRSAGNTAGTPSQRQYETLREEIGSLQKHIYHQVCNYRSAFDEYRAPGSNNTGELEQRMDDILLNLSTRVPRCIKLYQGNGFKPPSLLEAVARDVDGAYYELHRYNNSIVTNLKHLDPFPLVTLNKSSQEHVSPSLQDTTHQEQDPHHQNQVIGQNTLSESPFYEALADATDSQ